jgi:hypothetical protein
MLHSGQQHGLIPIWPIAGALVFVFCIDANAGGPADRKHEAPRVCASGSGHGFGHPSNACWAVYESAMERRDFAAAFEAVHVGCTRYARIDFCMFAANLKVTPDAIRAAATAAERYTIRRAFERAEAIVTVHESDDAEAPLIVAEAERLRRNTRQQQARVKTRLARNTAGATGSQGVQ